jgi:WD40 repeat protein
MPGFKSKKIQPLLASAKQWKKFTWLRPRMLCLDPPGSPLKKTLTGHTGSVGSVSFSMDGKYLASGFKDNTIKLWEVESGKEIASFCADSPICSVAVNKENQIAAGGYGTISFCM